MDYEKDDKKDKKRHANNKGWRPKDEETFTSTICEGMSKNSEAKGDEWMHMEAEDKCGVIENLLLETAELQREIEKRAPRVNDKKVLRELIQERKTARCAGAKEKVKGLCKQIRKEARAIERARQTAKVLKILEEFKGLKEIAGIRANGKRAIIGSIQAKDGSIKQERQSIADTFAEFYEDLYTAAQEATHSTEEIGG